MVEVEDLIASVFEKKSLWDQNDPHHHNRYVLDKLWKDVAQEMQSKKSNVRSRWKTLRDTFRREMRKMATGSSCDNGSQASQSPWRYYENLIFLKDQFPDQSNGDNLSSDEDNIEAKVGKKRSAPDTTLSLGSQIKRERRTTQEIPTLVAQTDEAKLQISQNKPSNVSDEDSSFFESLLPHVRTLFPQRKMLLRTKIQEFVYNFVYEKHNSNGKHSSASCTSDEI